MDAMQEQRKRHSKINIWEMVTICDYCFFLASFIVDRARCKWTGGSAVEVNIENERFTVVCSSQGGVLGISSDWNDRMVTSQAKSEDPKKGLSL